MRSPRTSGYRLTFVLPKAARLLPSGSADGWVEGCKLDIAGPFIAIVAISQKLAMEQAARVIRIACAKLSKLEIACRIETPGLPGSDGWTIVVNADIAFAPTPIGVVFPEEKHAAAQHLVG